jgi:hypothetical protein
MTLITRRTDSRPMSSSLPSPASTWALEYLTGTRENKNHDTVDRTRSVRRHLPVLSLKPDSNASRVLNSQEHASEASPAVEGCMRKRPSGPRGIDRSPGADRTLESERVDESAGIGFLGSLPAKLGEPRLPEGFRCYWQRRFLDSLLRSVRASPFFLSKPPKRQIRRGILCQLPCRGGEALARLAPRPGHGKATTRRCWEPSTARPSSTSA